ncbi:MAG: phosphoribosylanthranilate isomerase, partial [Gammaproteobacteria bacterium]|nr:phosphoribosylanthranilate isomerase [candidate division Zixibacteria bacterium]NIR92639.1 phosphoribosylanthranilate isomerase [Gammaproteobacteria bacterium]NIR63948.1 phosphoribosylanthranilate isomerase [candidate division Zixibacteria bacterium]NIS45867.1 phosphoribosylanthranilate isomerase [candidate division Zixibacteria bacterium]NIU14004.1 phosphoribosylanthranilate isomerase [candidate division Zixibacteria bacterium]
MFENGMIQVAGVIDRDEAQLLVDCGVRYLGFPLRLPVNKEDLSEEQAAALISGFPPGVKGVLITYLRRAEEVIA